MNLNEAEKKTWFAMARVVVGLFDGARAKYRVVGGKTEQQSDRTFWRVGADSLQESMATSRAGLSWAIVDHGHELAMYINVYCREADLGLRYYPRRGHDDWRLQGVLERFLADEELIGHPLREIYEQIPGLRARPERLIDARISPMDVIDAMVRFYAVKANM